MTQALTVDLSESPRDGRWADLAEILAGVMAVLVRLVLIATMAGGHKFFLVHAIRAGARARRTS